MQQIGFLFQNLLFAQHVSGTIMPTIRSSRVIQMSAACGTWLCKDGKCNLFPRINDDARSNSHQVYFCQTGKSYSRIEEPQTKIIQNQRCYMVQQNLQRQTPNSKVDLHQAPTYKLHFPSLQSHVPQAAAIYITLELLMMGIMVPETC